MYNSVYSLQCKGKVNALAYSDAFLNHSAIRMLNSSPLHCNYVLNRKITYYPRSKVTFVHRYGF